MVELTSYTHALVYSKTYSRKIDHLRYFTPGDGRKLDGALHECNPFSDIFGFLLFLDRLDSTLMGAGVVWQPVAAIS